MEGSKRRRCFVHRRVKRWSIVRNCLRKAQIKKQCPFGSIALSGAYLLEVVKGSRTVAYYAAFIVICWIPVVIGFLVLKIKGMATGIFKEVIAVGYGLFYLFVLMTTTSMLPVMYILPVASMLVLYKDRYLLMRCGIANILCVVAFIVKNYTAGINSPADIGYFVLCGVYRFHQSFKCVRRGNA